MNTDTLDSCKCIICMDHFKKPVIASDGNVYCENCISTWNDKNRTGPSSGKKVTHWTECQLFNKFYWCGLIRTDMNLFRLVDKSISEISECDNPDDALRIIEMIDTENSYILKEDINNTNLITQIFSNHDMIKKLIKHLDKKWSGADGWNISHYIFRFGSAEMIRFILDQEGYNLNAKTNDGWQLIHFILSDKNILESKNNLIIFKYLVNCGVDLENPVNDEQSLPIHFVSSKMNRFTSKDQLSVMKILLDRGVDADMADNKGWRPLHYICSGHNNFNSSDQLEAIEMMAKLPIEIDPLNHSMITPVNYLMCEKNRMSTCDKIAAFTILMSKQTLNLNNVDMNGNTIAHHVFMNNYENWTSESLEIINALIKSGVDLNSVNKDGFQPIHLLCNVDSNKITAMSSGYQLKIIKLLVDHGVNLDTVDGNGNKPVHLVCSKTSGLWSSDQLEVIKLFIEKKINIAVQSTSGIQAVNLICGENNNLTSNDQLRAIELLILNHIDMNKKDSNQWAAAQYICSNHNKLKSNHQFSAIKMLTMYDIDFNSPDDKGWRPIHDICSNGHNLNEDDQYEAIKMLINHGVDLNVATKNGLTALHQLASGAGNICGYQCLELLKMVIDRGVDLNAKSKDDYTAYNYASEIPRSHRYSEETKLAIMRLLLVQK